MFSGIVEETALIDSIIEGDPVKIRVRSCLDHSATNIGDSIAIDGVCLTVISIDILDPNKTLLEFELSQETMRCTTFVNKKINFAVNLERSLKLGDKISGHLVFGHVDGITSLISREPDGGAERYIWKLPQNLTGMITNKGSLSISGVSLTTANVKQEEFSTYIIPHTSNVTTLDSLKPGMLVNIEIDMLARYVCSYLNNRVTGS